MGALINILSYSLGSIFCGILLTVVCMLLMFLLVKSWWKDAMVTPANHVVCVLFVFVPVVPVGAAVRCVHHQVVL